MALLKREGLDEVLDAARMLPECGELFELLRLQEGRGRVVVERADELVVRVDEILQGLSVLGVNWLL